MAASSDTTSIRHSPGLASGQASTFSAVFLANGGG